jgi:hypothetical protein
VAGELLIAGGIALDCPSCGAGSVVALNATERRCPACTDVTAYRRCPRCDILTTIPPSVMRPSVEKWVCGDCRKTARRDRWHPAPVASFHKGDANPWVVEHYGDQVAAALSDPERRRMIGQILSITGISGMASGGCTVFFDRDSAVVIIGDSSHRRKLHYSEITSLQIGGRGDVVTTTTSGTRWCALCGSRRFFTVVRQDMLDVVHDILDAGNQLGVRRLGGAGRP